MDFTPAPAPVPPVVDQRVAPDKALGGMNAKILERLRQGPAMASELHAMFPGARSVRTRISNVGRWLLRHGEKLNSKPLDEPVGEWLYWIGGK